VTSAAVDAARRRRDDTWAAYGALRYAALGFPLTRIEQSAEQRAAATLSCYLGIRQAAAAYYARRCILFHRDQVLHEVLGLDLPARRMPEILSSATAVGVDQLATLDPSRGIVLVSLHYGLYSSVLIWWLAQATVNNLFKRLTVLVRSNPTGQYVASSRRLKDLQAAGVCSRSVTLFDRSAVGPIGTARALLGRLGPREAVLMFPDAKLRPAAEQTPTVTIGRYNLGLPRGAAWLAERRQSTVVPVYVRPHGDGAHAVVFGPAMPPASHDDATARVTATVQHLVNQTVMLDPSPWEGWLRESLRWLLTSRPGSVGVTMT
jgi:hypothetical protein